MHAGQRRKLARREKLDSPFDRLACALTRLHNRQHKHNPAGFVLPEGEGEQKGNKKRAKKLIDFAENLLLPAAAAAHWLRRSHYR